jgi:threonyl-tRNA synthetase
MNCPSTILIYKSRKRSYKELPMRLSIFDKLYRSERSGTVTGLFRVKELTQDDAHIFITEEQLQSEVTNYLKMLVETYEVFGLKYNANLSTMPDDHMGDEALWERATNALRQALEESKIPYGVKEKDGAFYGPKIDFDITDSAGRLWQCGTLQLDYQLPLRFKLEYTGEDGKQHSPIILHRTVIGSIERFTGIMVEHFQGRFPTWLAPLQVKIIPISEKQLKYGEKIYRELKKHRFRA